MLSPEKKMGVNYADAFLHDIFMFPLVKPSHSQKNQTCIKIFNCNVREEQYGLVKSKAVRIILCRHKKNRVASQLIFNVFFSFADINIYVLN